MSQRGVSSQIGQSNYWDLLQVCGPSTLRKGETSSCASWISMWRPPMTWWRCGMGRGQSPPCWVRISSGLLSFLFPHFVSPLRLRCVSSCPHRKPRPRPRLLLSNQQDGGLALHGLLGQRSRIQGQLHFGRPTRLTWYWTWEPRSCLASVDTAAVRFNYSSCSLRPAPCADGEFQCSAGGCIHGDRRCNGAVDCSDSSDEADCGGLGIPKTASMPTTDTFT